MQKPFHRDRETGLTTVKYSVKTRPMLWFIMLHRAPCSIINVKLDCDLELTPWCDNPGSWHQCISGKESSPFVHVQSLHYLWYILVVNPCLHLCFSGLMFLMLLNLLCFLLCQQVHWGYNLRFNQKIPLHASWHHPRCCHGNKNSLLEPNKGKRTICLIKCIT